MAAAGYLPGPSIRALDVPMGLVKVSPEIDSVCKARVKQSNHMLAHVCLMSILLWRMAFSPAGQGWNGLEA
jgi:hypothetical protein